MALYPELIDPSPAEVEVYWNLFINQPAYSLMTDDRDHPESNRFYRPRVSRQSESFKGLTVDTVRRHMRGEITCMFYAANPLTQTCKWACLDGDYPEAIEDLKLLQNHLRQLHLNALMEGSRRGGHLWLLCAEPLPSVQVRALLLKAIRDCGLPIYAGDVRVPGIEMFPRQDFLDSGRFGNGLRGPLGVHRKDFKRYWFDDASRVHSAQLALLQDSRSLTQQRLTVLTDGLVLPEFRSEISVVHSAVNGSRKVFSIFDHFPLPARTVGDYKVLCPACSERRLVISTKGARKGFYHCFTGCTTAAIRAALGQPLLAKR